MLPVLPLRDVVVYPHMVIPLFVGRERSILALEQAMKVDKQILLLAQKQADVDDPAAKDLYDVGTIASILQLLKLPDGTVKVLVEGVERAHGLVAADEQRDHHVRINHDVAQRQDRQRVEHGFGLGRDGAFGHGMLTSSNRASRHRHCAGDA